MPNYSYSDAPSPFINESNISGLSRSVLRNPPLPPVRPTTGTQGPAGPVPAAPVQGNSFMNFLSSLFGNREGAAQGMTGLLARGQGGAGTDQLGNPLGRF